MSVSRLIGVLFCLILLSIGTLHGAGLFQRRQKINVNQQIREALASQAARSAPEDLCDEASSEEIEAGAISNEEIEEARELLPPPLLLGDLGIKSHDLRGDARAVFEQLARAYGLEARFDPDYPAGGSQIRFRMEDATAGEALLALETMTASFLRPLGDRRFLVAKDTQQKRQEFEPNVAMVVPIPETVSVQEAQELARMIQQAMEIQKFVVDGTRRLVLMRDRVSKVYPAQKLFDQLLFHRPMVSVEIELLSVSSNVSRALGLSLPTGSQLLALAPRVPLKSVIPEGLKLVTFGGGLSTIGLAISSAELFATLTQGTGRSLYRTELKSVAMQPASILVGERYPILTAGYYGETNADPSLTVYRPPPTVNFENLGLTIKVTPFVHGEEDMTIELETEFKLLTGKGINDIPIIANRKLATRARLRTGEWAALGGLLNSAESKNYSGVQGLANLPVIGRFLRESNYSKETNELIVLIRPRLLSMPPPEELTKEFWVGSESRPHAGL